MYSKRNLINFTSIFCCGCCCVLLAVRLEKATHILMPFKFSFCFLFLVANFEYNSIFSIVHKSSNKNYGQCAVVFMWFFCFACEIDFHWKQHSRPLLIRFQCTEWTFFFSFSSFPFYIVKKHVLCLQSVCHIQEDFCHSFNDQNTRFHLDIFINRNIVWVFFSSQDY